MVKNSVFFGDRHSLKSKYHSSLVLDAWRLLIATTHT
jgi:hypothetical protein